MYSEVETVVSNWYGIGRALARHFWQIEIVWRVDVRVWLHLSRMCEDCLGWVNYFVRDLKRRRDCGNIISGTSPGCCNTC